MGELSCNARRARATAPHPDCKRSRAPLAVLRRRLSPSCRRLPFCAAGCGVTVVFCSTQHVRPSSRRGCWYAGCGSSHGPAPRFQEKCPCAPDCLAPQAFALMPVPAFLRRRLLVSLCFARRKPTSRRGILFRCVSMCSVVLHRDKAGQLSPKSGREHRMTD